MAEPSVVEELDDARCAELLPAWNPRSHKGSRGRLLVVAGSLDYAGAALLVARAAGRAGVGLTRIAVPESLQPVFAGRVWEATTLGLPETQVDAEVDPELALERILDVDHDALVLGPGLRPGLATVELVEDLLHADDRADDQARDGSRARTPSESPAAAVLDAEALNSLATLPRWWEGVRRSCVLTPHPGEFARLRAGDSAAALGDDADDLSGDDDLRAERCRAAAAEWRQVVVLKGARTVIASADGRVTRAPFANPALATAGTGDVLSGAIGALLAQGLAPFDAACLGVYLHGVAGEAVRERFGDTGLLASDLPDELALAARRLAALRERARRPVGFAVAEPAG